MDVLEKAFQALVRYRDKRKGEPPGRVEFKKISRYVDTLANGLLGDGRPLQSLASRDFVGLHGANLLLPEKIDLFAETALNRRLYLNLVVQIVGAQRLGVVDAVDSDFAIGRRLRFLSHSFRINTLLDQLLPEYSVFQKELMGAVESLVRPSSSYYDRVFQYWRSLVLNRSPSAVDLEPLMLSHRRRDRTPDFLYLTVPCLEVPQAAPQVLQETTARGSSPDQARETELEKTYSGLNQTVDLEKERANPVMHSFEKIETADEYGGGRRADSGDDELSDHAPALEELNLTHVTRGGEAAKSVFKSEGTVDVVAAPGLSRAPPTRGQFYYPEWNFKRHLYMQDYCRLTENPVSIAVSPQSTRTRLVEQNRARIVHWQSRIQNLFSEPLWFKKLTEGDEIDLDEVIRDLGNRQSGQSLRARWYMNRRKKVNDVEVVILFDQSHSADSWICNRRVLDVTLDSVGMAGLLFDRVIHAVTVAGVWSATRHHCSFQIYKERDRPWEDFFNCTEAIQAQGHTRLGPAIRHATENLKKSSRRKKLILLLTDGKPTDLDGYEGAMGVRDVSQACREAERSGILHFALVLDQSHRVHHGKMFNHYRLLNHPKDFAEELFRILFQLVHNRG